MENSDLQKNYIIIFAIVGFIIGIPLSYLFQPEIVRMKFTLGQYISALPKLFSDPERNFKYIVPFVMTCGICSFLSGLLGNFLGKLKSDQSPSAYNFSSVKKITEKKITSNYDDVDVDNETRAVMQGYEVKLKADPSNVQLMLDYANFLYSKSANNEAILVLLKAITIDDTHLDAKLLLFNGYIKSEKNDKAILIGKELFDTSCDKNEFLSTYAELLINEGSDDQAFAVLNKLLKSDPENINYLTLSAKLLQEKNYIKSIKCWKKVLAIDPDNADALYLIGVDDFQKEEFRSSAKKFKKLLSIVDNNEDLYDNGLMFLTLSLEKIGGFEKELNQLLQNYKYQNAINKKLHNVELKTRFFILLAENKKIKKLYNDAITILEKILDINATLDAHKQISDVYYLIASNSFKKNDISRAENNIRLAIEHNKNDKKNVALLKEITKLKKSKSFRIKFAVLAIIILCGCTLGIWYSAHGKLNIKTDVVAENIIILKDGEIIAKATNTNELFETFISIGQYSLKVEAAGYEEFGDNISVGWLSNSNIDVKLSPVYGGIKINSQPGEMNVFIDKNMEGKTPFYSDKILAKKTEVELKKDGYYWKKIVDINKDEVLDLKKPICNFSLDNLSLQQITDPSPQDADYFADFKEKLGGWTNTKNKNYSTEIKNGKLFFSTHSVGRYIWGQGYSEGDFWLSVDLQKTSSGYKNAYYGIVFRADYIPIRKNRSKSIWTFFGITDKGKYKIIEYKSSDGGHTLSNEKSNNYFGNKLNNLAVQCIGDKYRCYINGKWIATVNNSRHGGAFKGAIGVGTDSGRITVSYDNIFLKNLPYICNLSDEHFIEKFDGNKKGLEKKYFNSLKFKNGKAHYIRWRGWKWNDYFSINEDNYSIKINGAATGKNAKWGPVLLATHITKKDGNRKYTNSYCIGVHDTKNSKKIT